MDSGFKGSSWDRGNKYIEGGRNVEEKEQPALEESFATIRRVIGIRME
jgi:hypothetical protein